MTRQPDGRIDVALVKEFYANFFDPEEKSSRQVQVRGKLIKFDGETLNTFLETPVVFEPGERYLAYSRFCHTHLDPQELALSSAFQGHGFVLNTEGAPWKLLRKDLTTLVQTWSILSYSNLASISNTSDLNMDRARLVYGLVTNMDMDVGSFISRQISQMAQSNSSRLGFPALINALCIARGVVPDSLTFKSLSPAINLAYIRKNCWNPDDPTITFPGTRKAQARAPSDASAPSSSAPTSPAPTPAPPAPAPTPSGTSAQSTEILVSMLQSLHHGLCLVMQSIHNLAQHRPIISMEDFMAQVAWPGVQPSPMGEGEAPTAQELQPEVEAEAEETPKVTPATTKEGDGAASADYIANMAAAQST